MVSTTCAEIFAHNDTFTTKYEQDRLMKENLVYLLVGGTPFIGRSLKAIVKQLLVLNVACLDVSSTRGSAELINHSTSLFKTAMGKRSLVVLHGIESLNSEDLEKLNYLYRITDSTYEYSNIIVTLVWNNDSLPVHMNNNNNDVNKYWRAVVGDIWSRNGSLVNGAALAGRISRSGLENCNDDYIPSSSGSSNTGFKQSNNYNDMQQVCDDLITTDINYVKIYATCIIVLFTIIVTYFYRKRNKSKREKGMKIDTEEAKKNDSATTIRTSQTSIPTSQTSIPTSQTSIPTSSTKTTVLPVSSDITHKHNTRSKGKK